MYLSTRCASLVTIGLLFALAAAPASAAETLHTCTGTVNAVPAIISTQGTWCLTKDLSTALATGSAIEITTNNVTIDCNGFKLGGLNAGAGTTAKGIFADAKINITVRNCNVRGFLFGIHLAGGAGHLVEDNRLDLNRLTGLYVVGDGSRIRRNLVSDTGGNTGANFARAIQVGEGVDAIDNVVFGVIPGTGSVNGSVAGIYLHDGPTLLQGNRVAGLIASGTGTARAIDASQTPSRARIVGNVLFGPGTFGSTGIFCPSGELVSITDNYIADFSTGHFNCTDDPPGNVVK